MLSGVVVFISEEVGGGAEVQIIFAYLQCSFLYGNGNLYANEEQIKNVLTARISPDGIHIDTNNAHPAGRLNE